MILQTLRRPAGSDAEGSPYYDGGIDGAFGPLTDKAVRAFQGNNRLAVDGIAGPQTRSALYPLYMDAVCISPDDRFVMDPKDFVGEGADPKGKGAMQGCGEFNPVRVLSKADQNRDQRSRDAKNAPNRRVLVFLFEKELLPPFASWPCPRATEGSAGCTAQFFPDADARRAVTAEQKTYRKERNTMACAFYDRLARASPCEGGVRFQVLEGRILLARGGPAANMPFVVRVGGRVVDGGFTDAQGRYRVEGVAGSTEVALVDRLQMAASSDEPGQEVVAVRTRPLRDDEDPTFGDDDDTAVA
ncbi:MAG: peptidoglycan-binding domain-containing protein [Polyangiaceae bacterium]